jgi:hypothetical protein
MKTCSTASHDDLVEALQYCNRAITLTRAALTKANGGAP